MCGTRGPGPDHGRGAEPKPLPCASGKPLPAVSAPEVRNQNRLEHAVPGLRHGLVLVPGPATDPNGTPTGTTSRRIGLPPAKTMMRQWLEARIPWNCWVGSEFSATSLAGRSKAAESGPRP